MKFTKMHGIGNDYIYINCFEEMIENPSELAIWVSERHFGMGSDGLILIKPSDKADFMMDMYNADGSRGKMCGNGIRCVGKYVYDHGMTDKETIYVETLSGIKKLDFQLEDAGDSKLSNNGKVVKTVTVNMGTPSDIHDIDVDIDGTIYHGKFVSMGNPHIVILVDDTDNFPVHTIGPKFEKNPIFPEGVNTEFVQIVDDAHVKMRVWERGSGETLACGTGATATAVATHLFGKTGTKVDVELLGGTLNINWDKESNYAYMTGPAATVYEGETV